MRKLRKFLRTKKAKKTNKVQSRKSKIQCRGVQERENKGKRRKEINEIKFSQTKLNKDPPSTKTHT